MTIEPSTSNEELADALAELATDEDVGAMISSEHLDALVEAEQRIRELGDE